MWASCTYMDVQESKQIQAMQETEKLRMIKQSVFSHKTAICTNSLNHWNVKYAIEVKIY